MAVRSSRARKDLAASFHRLRRMIIDVKSARKSLVAHHSLVAELVSVSLYPSLKDSLPRNGLQLDECQYRTPQPLSVLPPKPHGNPPDPLCLASLQLNNTQDFDVDSMKSVICSSSASKISKVSSFPSVQSIPSKISGSVSSLASVSDTSLSDQETGSLSANVLKTATHPDQELRDSYSGSRCLAGWR